MRRRGARAAAAIRTHGRLPAAVLLAAALLLPALETGGRPAGDPVPSLTVVPFRLPPFGYCEHLTPRVPPRGPAAAGEVAAAPAGSAGDPPPAPPALPDRFSLARHDRVEGGTRARYDAPGGGWLTVEARTLDRELPIPAPPGAATPLRIDGRDALLLRGGFVSTTIRTARGRQVVHCEWSEGSVARLYRLSGESLLVISATPASVVSDQELLDVARSLAGDPAAP